jgi:hypothetical protein
LVTSITWVRCVSVPVAAPRAKPSFPARQVGLAGACAGLEAGPLGKRLSDCAPELASATELAAEEPLEMLELAEQPATMNPAATKPATAAVPAGAGFFNLVPFLLMAEMTAERLAQGNRRVIGL